MATVLMQSHNITLNKKLQFILTWLDRYLQQRRIKKVVPYIPANAALLDIGCHKGELLVQVKHMINEGVGIDPHCINGK